MQLLGLLKVVPAGDVADACDAIMDSGVVDNLFHGCVHLLDHGLVHAGRSHQVVVDQHVAVLETLLLQSLVVFRQLSGVLVDGDAVARHGADDLQLAGLGILLSVAQTHDTDVDESTGQIGQTVRLGSTFNLVQLDAQNTAQLAEQEGVCTCSRHTGVQLIGMRLCVIDEALKVIVRCVCRNSQCREAVVLQAGDQGEVGHGVYGSVAGDVLDVQ